MSWNLPVNNSEWIVDTCQFNEDFIKYWFWKRSLKLMDNEVFEKTI